MKDFKVTKRGRYYNVICIGLKSTNIVFNVYYCDNVYFNNRKEVENFITYVRDIEVIINRLNPKYSVKKIILYYLKTIESISSGFDVRSSWTKEEFSNILIEWYNKKYTEADEFCKSTLEWINSNKCNYYSDWKRFDEYNNKNQIFELGLVELKSNYDGFTEDPLDKMLELAHELLDKLIEENRNKNNL